MQLLSQPFGGQLGNFLIDTLESGPFESLHVAVAFAKNSGVLRLRDSLIRFRENGGDVHIYVGVDLNGTSYEALSNLIPVATTIHVVHDEGGKTFHSKLFNFTSIDRSVLVVGSNNLTLGGLWTNFETSTIMDLDLGDPDDRRTQESVNSYLGTLRGLSGVIRKLETLDDVEDLLDARYVEKEVVSRIRNRRVAAAMAREVLFGSTPRPEIPALPPTDQHAGPSNRADLAYTPGSVQVAPEVTSQSSTPQSSISLTTGHGDPTLWLETRKMTGGSRNILDLSRVSLLRSGGVAGTEFALDDPALMRGAVQFFNVDPTDTDEETQITINFEGVDYEGNTILFPKGEKANGTWRIQLNGVSANQFELTKVLNQRTPGGYLLPEKIVTFTKVRPDYYHFSVFDDSKLNDFLDASTITAYNGRVRTAKLLGIL